MGQGAEISSMTLMDEKGEQVSVIRLRGANDLSRFQIGNDPRLFMLSSLMGNMDIPVFVGVAKKWGQFMFADENYDRFVKFLENDTNHLYLINGLYPFEYLTKLKSLILNNKTAYPYLDDFNQ
jgi:hypothetical protein